MQEAFLHYVWQFQYFEKSDLTTTGHEPVQIFHPGYRNTNAGPDFSQARIRIGEIEWIGNVEIHIYSSAWREHHHQLDPAYGNVILHVVWEEDELIPRADKSPLPTIRLNGRVSESLLLRYNSLLSDRNPIHCSSVIKSISGIKILSMKERALCGRLESRIDNIKDLLRMNRNDWEETCYQLLAKNFGFRVNAEPFQQLSKNLPYRFIRKHADKLLQIEALLFGQAGFLDHEYVDQYFNLLKREHSLMMKKFDLGGMKMNAFQWRFLRLRPSNFPTIRIAQFAALLCKERQLFSTLMNASSYKDFTEILEVEQSDYWKHHYLFTKFIKNPVPSLGRMSVDSIIINTAVPLMVAFGKNRGDDEVLEKAMTILQQIPPEENSIVKTWVELGIECSHAFDSQALLEMFNRYCEKKRCLECAIGSSLFAPTE